MRKVVNFSKKKNFWSGEPDLDLLNTQIREIENDGWHVVSVAANSHFIIGITSYTILIESMN
ncbi:hypothetical protein [Cognaticolwellia beringensis]|uniref:DUF4177 domain-containing protein n=1 Tax=Cognaticolwellia beringensis TaxID=1967665 RepID=A0A222GD83_9GAMM|nr:hypothetical protein [Cognaticolwellia beringensis]ASP49751.1 hypothetical protein B5D82_19425 [Cognaticolwellia beringensis]